MEEHGIGWAVKQLWAGNKLTRTGWNGPGQSLQLEQPSPGSSMTKPFVFINTVDGGKVPWLASQTDLLASDWELAEATA